MTVLSAVQAYNAFWPTMPKAKLRLHSIDIPVQQTEKNATETIQKHQGFRSAVIAAAEVHTSNMCI